MPTLIASPTRVEAAGNKPRCGRAGRCFPTKGRTVRSTLRCACRHFRLAVCTVTSERYTPMFTAVLRGVVARVRN
jgi:hypothetical protein